MAGQAGTVGAGALNPDQADVTKPAHPVGQRRVASPVDGKGLHAQHAAEVVDDGGHMNLGMGVHPTGQGARRYHGCHCHSFCSQLVKGWHRTTGRADAERVGLGEQDD